MERHGGEIMESGMMRMIRLIGPCWASLSLSLSLFCSFFFLLLPSSSLGIFSFHSRNARTSYFDLAVVLVKPKKINKINKKKKKEKKNPTSIHLGSQLADQKKKI